LLSQQFLSIATGAVVATNVGYATNVGNMLDYGLTAYDMFNKFTNSK
jgi:hypothetical protein